MEQLKGVLLDVDGTLVDSNDAHTHAWVRALSEHGVSVPFAKIRRLIGKGGDKLLPEVTGIAADSSRGEAINRSRKEIFLKDLLPLLRPFPGVKEFLGRMKASGLRLAVASSAKQDELEKLLKVCGASEFLTAQTSADDAENSKPDPDIIHAALGKIGFPASQVILLGDTPYDVAAGVQASVRVVALRCGGWRDDELTGAIALYDNVQDILTHYGDSPFHGAGAARA